MLYKSVSGVQYLHCMVGVCREKTPGTRPVEN